MSDYATRAAYYDIEFATTDDFELIRKLIPTSGTVLDVPCGAGRLMPLYAERRNKVVMIDLEPMMIDACSRRREELGIADRIHLRIDDLRRFPLEEPPQVVLVSRGGLQMLATLEDVRRSLAHLVSISTTGTVLYFDIMDAWNPTAVSLPAYVRDRTGEEVLSGRDVTMRRSWRSAQTECYLTVDFAYEVTNGSAKTYEARSRWLRLERETLERELMAVGLKDVVVMGDYSGGIRTATSTRTIIVATVS